MISNATERIYKLPKDLIKLADNILNDKGSYKGKYLLYKNELYSMNYKEEDIKRLKILVLLRKEIDPNIIEYIDKKIGIPEEIKIKLRNNKKKRNGSRVK